MLEDDDTIMTEDEVIITVTFGMNGSLMKDTKFNMKIAYMYEENSEIKYLYSPAFSCSYNELVS